MRALVIDRSRPSGTVLGSAPDPRPAPDEALVRVGAFSVNPGDLAALRDLDDGAVPGWEAAGHVVESAADGSGPAPGSVVTTFGYAGAWAEYRAVRTDMLGVAPQGSDLAAISTVPIAANSALRALRHLGPVLGKRVMITGATGGVGRYAVQLARLAGAEPIAVSSSADSHEEQLRSLGARIVVSDPADSPEPSHGVVDTVGGKILVRAFDMLDDHGVLVSLGHLDTDGSTFPHGALMANPSRNHRTIVSFHQFDGTALTPDLTWLSEQLAQRTLHPWIAWRDTWTRADEALNLLAGGQAHGKIILDVD